MTLTHLDLFSGIGGFALAAQWAGFTTVGFAEIDPFCSKVLKKHWPHIPNHGDVRNVRGVGKLDLITGGFPCQPFSCAGKRQGRNDDRHMWPYFHALIRDHRPRFVLAENVAGIVRMELDAILNDLEALSYTTEAIIVPACAVGAPHRRERVWIIAYANRQRCSYGFDHPVWGHLQTHWQRDVETVQTERFGFVPKSWKTFNFQNWFGLTPDPDGFPGGKADTNTIAESNERHAWQGHPRCAGGGVALRTGEESQPPIPGVDDGLPDGVDRNKALGNAIVPQVAYVFLRLLALIGGVTHD